MSDTSQPAAGSTPPPAAGTEAPPAPAEKRRLAPIPPPGSKASAPADPASLPPRDETGKFTSTAADEPGFESRELDPETRHPLNPHNFPKHTFPGMPSERLEDTKGIRVHQRKSMRDQLASAARAHLEPDAPAVEVPKDGQAAPVAGQPAADGQAAPTTAAKADASAAPPAQKFTMRTHRDPKTNEWVEESWDSFDKFQENYRTLRGMHRAIDRRAAEAEQNAQNLLAKIEAYENGTLPIPGQKQPAARVAQPQGEQREAQEDAAPRAPEEEYLEAVDWAKYNSIVNNPQQGERVAAAWLAQQAVRFSINKMNEQLEERERPHKEQAATFEAGRAIRAKVTEMSEWTNPDGSVFYPELQDNSTLREIAAAVDQLHRDGVPLTILRTEKGVHQAILLWRDWRNRTGRPWAANGHAPHAAPPNVPSAPLAGNGVAEALSDLSAHNAGVIGGRNAPFRPAPPKQPGDAIRQLITGKRETSELGWEV